MPTHIQTLKVEYRSMYKSNPKPSFPCNAPNAHIHVHIHNIVNILNPKNNAKKFVILGSRR
jgi:hypothetical protein